MPLLRIIILSRPQRVWSTPANSEVFRLFTNIVNKLSFKLAMDKVVLNLALISHVTSNSIRYGH
jgi:hypothetical protein